MIQASGDALELPVDFTNQPWELAIPPSGGGPAAEPYSTDQLERQLLESDSDLVPLVALFSPEIRQGASIICYRLSELAAGRPTVFKKRHLCATEAAEYGNSLLTVPHRV